MALPNLPAAAHNAMVQSMLRTALLEVLYPDSASSVLRITAAGLEGLEAGVEPGRPEATEEAAASPQEGRVGQRSTTALPNHPGGAGYVRCPPADRTTLRGAAADLWVAWDAGEGRPDLPSTVETLRTALGLVQAARPARDPSTPGRPCEGTKQPVVLTLLCRPEGATITQIVEATGWAQHTVRGFLARLKGNGHTIEVLERVRQVGPGSRGAKGSYSVYRIPAGEQG